MTPSQVVASFDASDGLAITYGGRLVADYVTPTLRDGSWGTIALACVGPAAPSPDPPARSDAGAGLRVALEHVTDDGPAITWELTARCGVDHAEIEVRGVCRRNLWFRRAGLCLSLPIAEYLGSTFTAALPDGRSWQGRVTEWIAPQRREEGSLQPLGPAFSEIHFTGSGWQHEFTLSGDLFEIEDQRNWSDPSLKIYCTPLGLSERRQLLAGEVVSHSLVVRVRPPDPGAARGLSKAATRIPTARPPTAPDRVVLRETAPHGPGPHLAAVGLRVRSSDPSHALTPLDGCRVNHLRVDVDSSVASCAWLPRLLRSTSLELAVPLDLPHTWLDPWLEVAGDGSVRRVLVERPDRRVVTPLDLQPWIDRLRPLWTKVVTGTADQFAELNRSRDTDTTSGAVAFSITAQAHHGSDRAIMQTLETHTQLGTQASALHPGCRVVVSPATLARHELEDPPSADPRAVQDLGVAWTAASLVKLSLGGIDSVTFHEPLPLLSMHGSTRRLTDLLTWLSAHAGAGMGTCATSHPGVVEWTTFHHPTPGTLVVNLTAEHQVASVPGGRTIQLDGYEVAYFR